MTQSSPLNWGGFLCLFLFACFDSMLMSLSTLLLVSNHFLHHFLYLYYLSSSFCIVFLSLHVFISNFVFISVSLYIIFVSIFCYWLSFLIYICQSKFLHFTVCLAPALSFRLLPLSCTHACYLCMFVPLSFSDLFCCSVFFSLYLCISVCVHQSVPFNLPLSVTLSLPLPIPFYVCLSLSLWV